MTRSSRSGSSASNKSRNSANRSNSKEKQIKKGENSNEQKPDERCLYIGNIDRKCTQKQVKELFQKFGPMEYCYIVYEPGSGTNSQQAKISRGYGFAKYLNNSDAQTAKSSLEGKQLLDRILNIQVSKRDKPRQSTPGRYLGRKKTSPPRRDDRDRRDRDRDRYRRRSYSRSYSSDRRHKKHHQKERKQKYSDRDGRRQRNKDRSQEKKSKRKRDSHSRSYSPRHR